MPEEPEEEIKPIEQAEVEETPSGLNYIDIPFDPMRKIDKLFTNRINVTTVSAGTVAATTITGDTVCGITSANLVDKSATEAITGNWRFDGSDYMKYIFDAGNTGYFCPQCNTYPAFIRFQRCETSFSSPSIVSNNHVLGGIDWQGYDGNSWAPAAAIKGEVDGTPGNGDMPGRLVFYTSPDGTESYTEKMRIDNGGLITITSRIAGLNDPTASTDACTKHYAETSAAAIALSHSQKEVGIDEFAAAADVKTQCSFFSLYNSDTPIFCVNTDIGVTTQIHRYNLDSTTKGIYQSHQVAGQGGMNRVFGTAMGSYVYLSNVKADNSYSIYRYDIADLGTATSVSASVRAPTYETNGYGNPIFNDGTYLYIYDGTSTIFLKYSVSDTVATFEASAYAFGVSAATAPVGGVMCDGTNVYVDFGGTSRIKKYILGNGIYSAPFLDYSTEHIASYNDITNDVYPFAGIVYIDSDVFGVMRYSWKTQSAGHSVTYGKYLPFTKP